MILRNYFWAIHSLMTVTAFAQTDTYFFAQLDSLYKTPYIQQSFILKKTVDNAYPLDFNPELSNAGKEKIKRIAFYYLLLTCKGATNGNEYGALGILYFWNYGSVNPRDSIYFRALSKPLCKLPPPKGFEKYQSYSSIDRTPYFFWSDLACNSAKYEWRGKPFYSFGWCSEREMAFKSLLNLKGIKSTICFEGIHVWNEIELPELAGYFIKVDNTFNTFDILPLAKRSKPNFTDKYLIWYNSQANSQKAMAKLSQLRISYFRMNEIRRKINSFF